MSGKIIHSCHGSWVKEEPEDRSNQIKSNMYKIIDGKMTLDGVEVPLEIGNRAQIECLQKCEKRVEEFKEGLDVLVDSEMRGWEHTVSFTCVCGTLHAVSEDSEDEDPHELDGKNRTCYKCGTKYEIKQQKDEEWFKVYIVK